MELDGDLGATGISIADIAVLKKGLNLSLHTFITLLHLLQTNWNLS